MKARYSHPVEFSDFRTPNLNMQMQEDQDITKRLKQTQAVARYRKGSARMPDMEVALNGSDVEA